MGYFLIKYNGGELPYTGNYGGIKSYCDRKGISWSSIIEFPDNKSLEDFIKEGQK